MRRAVVTITSGKSMAGAEGLIDCHIVLTGGSLLFNGAVKMKDLGAGVTVPVVGGTGRYAGAGGSVKMSAPNDVPEWRFQMQGSDAISPWLNQAQPGGCTVASWRADATEHGAIVEIEQHLGEEISRNIHRLDVRGGKIVEWTMYCTGNWSAETQETHRREAPMIRPDAP